VDSVDLIQLHYLVDPQEWKTAFDPRGALEALIEAREQRLVRFIGVTGHDLTVAHMHLRSLSRYDFDSVLLPYNYMTMLNAQYAADFETLLTLCRERNVAVQTIKSIAKGPWGEKAHTHATWYEPLTDQKNIDTAVAFVLSRPGIFLNTTGDIHVLPKVLDAADHFNKDTDEAQVSAEASKLPLEPLFVK
jgi:predicted aldo/keto reductase-like oxidoreductase